MDESAIRTIRDNKEKIHESAKTLGQHAKPAKVVGYNFIEKVEDMLMIWIQDLMYENFLSVYCSNQRSS